MSCSIRGALGRVGEQLLLHLRRELEPRGDENESCAADASGASNSDPVSWVTRVGEREHRAHLLGSAAGRPDVVESATSAVR